MGRPVANASPRGVPWSRPGNCSIYTARFESYRAYLGLLNGPPFSRTGNVSGNLNTEGKNTGGAVPKLPNGSFGSSSGGNRSDLKIVSQLASASGHFDSSILLDSLCKGKILQ